MVFSPYPTLFRSVSLAFNPVSHLLSGSTNAETAVGSQTSFDVPRSLHRAKKATEWAREMWKRHGRKTGKSRPKPKTQARAYGGSMNPERTGHYSRTCGPFVCFSRQVFTLFSKQSFYAHTHTQMPEARI